MSMLMRRSKRRSKIEPPSRPITTATVIVFFPISGYLDILVLVVLEIGVDAEEEIAHRVFFRWIQGQESHQTVVINLKRKESKEMDRRSDEMITLICDCNFINQSQVTVLNTMYYTPVIITLN